MTSPADTTRLQELTSRLCDGELSAQEICELSALLEADEEAIGEYLAQTSLHFDLGQRLLAQRPEDACATSVEALTAELGESNQPASSGTPQRGQRWQQLMLLAVAASLLLASAIFYFAPGGGQAPFAARIVQKIDCDWGEQRWGTPQSASLNIGREIKLDTGLMVLEFGNGAEVTLEAPIRFTVLARDRGELTFGRLVAAVPVQGHGFTIQMPSMEAIDLGTKFGASVAADGACETHVFEGSVLVRSNPGEQSQRDWRLGAGAAMRIQANSTAVEELAASSESFLHLADFSDSLAAQQGPALNLPAGANLALWLDAARRLQFDERKNVVGWGDLASDDDGSADNAWQVQAERRPQWVDRAIGARPAVRFDGAAHLVTTPMPVSDDVSIVCVVQGRSGQIFNSNGPPTLILELTDNNEVVGKLISNLDNQPSAPGVSLRRSAPQSGPMVAAYVYSKSANRSSLFVNGQHVGDSQALSTTSNRSPKLIGASNLLGDHLAGDIGEILVFNSALAPEECAQLSAELMEKYGIAESDAEPQILSRPSRGEP